MKISAVFSYTSANERLLIFPCIVARCSFLIFARTIRAYNHASSIIYTTRRSSFATLFPRRNLLSRYFFIKPSIAKRGTSLVMADHRSRTFLFFQANTNSRRQRTTYPFVDPLVHGRFLLLCPFHVQDFYERLDRDSLEIEFLIVDLSLIDSL